MDATGHGEVESLARALDLHSLRILVEIDRTGSISAAARSLGFSQPTITQHVQRLEAKLGTALLTRAGKGATLTSSGTLLALHCPRIDATLTAAATELALLLGRRGAAVRFVAMPGAVEAVLAPAVTRVATLDPELEFSVAEVNDSIMALDAVTAGTADVAVIETLTGRGGHLASRLRSTFLFSDEVVALTTSDVAAPGARVDVRDLAGSPWISSGVSVTDAVATIVDRPRGPSDIVVSSLSAAIALAEIGLGTVFVAEGALAALDVPRHVRVLGLAQPLRRRVVAVTLAEAAGNSAVATALRALTLHRPALAEVHIGLDAHRRRAGHRVRFAPAAPHAAAFPIRLEEENTMPLLSRNSLVRVGAIVAVSAVALTACSVRQDPTSPTTSAAQGVDTGQEIDNITVALPGSLSNLYVGQEAGILNYYIAAITQEGLVTIDSHGAIQPGLAKSWKQTDDVTYVYELRDDAKFQDGTPVTADDVVFSLEKAKDETVSPGLAYYLTNVDKIEKTGDHEVTITLTAPDAAFAANMSAGGAAFITSQKFWEEHKGAVGTPDALLLGSGPYKVTEFVPDSHVTFERVDTWWGDLPKVKKITVNFIPDETTRLLAAKSGDVDVAFNVPLAQADQWEALDTVRVEYVNDLSYVGLYFNVNVAPFDDPKVREAVAHAVNREAYVKTLLHGHGEAATAIETPESLAKVYSADEARKVLSSIPQWDYDLNAAKAALAASGHPDGFDAEILTPNTGPQLGAAAQALSQDLAQIGIKLTVREVPIEEWLASIDPSSDHGINFMWYFSTLGDPAEIPSYLLGAGNATGNEDPAIIALLGKVGAEKDPAARVDLLVKAETLQAQQVVNVPLWWGQSATAFAKDLGTTDYSSFSFVSAWPTRLYRAG
jgi:molybdate transport repressor ModE-like protein